jgi:hypothetical protein
MLPMSAKVLARDHTVVVPDLRGMGLSTKPAAQHMRCSNCRLFDQLVGAGSQC